MADPGECLYIIIQFGSYITSRITGDMLMNVFSLIFPCKSWVVAWDMFKRVVMVFKVALR